MSTRLKAARRPAQWLLCAALMSLLVACATVTRGPLETFRIESTPSGAMASSTTGWDCVTPCSVSIKRRGDFVVTIRKKGYTTQTVAVQSVPAAAARGPGGVAVPTGMVGSVTDMMTGANYEHVPNPVKVVLEREL